MAVSSTIPSFDVATQGLRDLNERLLDAGRRVGLLSLDAYEQTVQGVTAVQQRLGEQSDVEAVRTLVDAQVEITREVAKAQTAVARRLLA
jgi:hypothetical protein